MALAVAGAVALIATAGAVSYGRARAAAPDPKAATHMTELDFANFRGDVSEINAVINGCQVQVAPLRIHAQGILDKYGLQLEGMSKAWGVDPATRQIQRMSAPPGEAKAVADKKPETKPEAKPDAGKK